MLVSYFTLAVPAILIYQGKRAAESSKHVAVAFGALVREIRRPWFASRLRVSSLRLSLKLTLNFNMQARRSYGGGHFGHRSLTGSFKDHINKTYGYKGMFLDMAWFAYGDRLSKKTLKQLVEAKFFQTDHILSTLCDDPENFFLMPAPLNVRFNIQSYQDFKRTFCGPGWAAAVFFVDKAIALQRQYGNY